jgi:hypothetical protein
MNIFSKRKHRKAIPLIRQGYHPHISQPFSVVYSLALADRNEVQFVNITTRSLLSLHLPFSNLAVF